MVRDNTGIRKKMPSQLTLENTIGDVFTLINAHFSSNVKMIVIFGIVATKETSSKLLKSHASPEVQDVLQKPENDTIEVQITTRYNGGSK